MVGKFDRMDLAGVMFDGRGNIAAFRGDVGDLEWFCSLNDDRFFDGTAFLYNIERQRRGTRAECLLHASLNTDRYSLGARIVVVRNDLEDLGKRSRRGVFFQTDHHRVGRRIVRMLFQLDTQEIAFALNVADLPALIHAVDVHWNGRPRLGVY